MSVTVAQPDYSDCVACGSRRFHEEALRKRLRECARVLGSLDARKRQLTGAQRRALRFAKESRKVLISLAVVGMIPLTGFLCCCVAPMIGELEQQWSYAVIGATPLLVFTSGVAVLLLWMLRAGKTLARACCALPPVVEGGAARCFVCGGPLDVALDVTSDKRDSNRCGYCGTDNVIDPKELSRMAGHTDIAIGDLEQAVHTEARASTGRQVLSLGCALALFIVSPFTCCVPIVAEEPLSVALMNSPHEDVRYVVIRSEDEACVAKITRKGGQRVAKHDGDDRRITVPYSDGPTFQADELVGRTVRFDHGAEQRRKKVEAIFGFLGEDNNGMAIEGQFLGNPHLDSLCLVDSSDDLPTVSPRGRGETERTGNGSAPQ